MIKLMQSENVHMTSQNAFPDVIQKSFVRVTFSHIILARIQRDIC